MARIKRNEIKVFLAESNKNTQLLVFSFKRDKWIKTEISTCVDNDAQRVTVRFNIRPFDDEECLCKILACYKLSFSLETLRIENKTSYVERIREWFDKITIDFPNDKECIIEMGTVTPAPVRLKTAVMFVVEAVTASLLTGLAERKKIQNIDKRFNKWISETFSNGFSIQTTWDKKKRKEKQKEQEDQQANQEKEIEQEDQIDQVKPTNQTRNNAPDPIPQDIFLFEG